MTKPLDPEFRARSKERALARLRGEKPPRSASPRRTKPPVKAVRIRSAKYYVKRSALISKMLDKGEINSTEAKRRQEENSLALSTFMAGREAKALGLDDDLDLGEDVIEIKSMLEQVRGVLIQDQSGDEEDAIANLEDETGLN